MMSGCWLCDTQQGAFRIELMPFADTHRNYSAPGTLKSPIRSGLLSKCRCGKLRIESSVRGRRI